MKKINVIIPIVLMTIILLVVLLYFVLNRSNTNTNTNNMINNVEDNPISSNVDNNDKPVEQPETNYHIRTTVNVQQDIKTYDIEKRIKEVIKQSYQYYLLSGGNVSVDNNRSITKNGKKYNLVLLDGINSVDDINKLIEELFVNAFITIKKEEVFKDKDYISENGKLYLNIKEPLCKVNYDLNKMTYSYRVINNVVYVAFSEGEKTNFEFQLFNEDGKYKVSAPFYDCRFG